MTRFHDRYRTRAGGLLLASMPLLDLGYLAHKSVMISRLRSSNIPDTAVAIPAWYFVFYTIRTLSWQGGKSSMTGEGFGNLRVLSLESRRLREMGSLIAHYGGQATVVASTREVPLGPNAEESAFVQRLVQGQFQVVIFMTGVGTRALAQAVEPRVCVSSWSRR